MPQPVARTVRDSEDRGSIIIVVATDAPLLPNQAKRLARRASLGLARLGSTSGDGSGDIFIAFSTANPQAATTPGVATISMLRNDAMGPIFDATVQAVEEAIVNAMVVSAGTRRRCTGRRGKLCRKSPAVFLNKLGRRRGLCVSINFRRD